MMRLDVLGLLFILTSLVWANSLLAQTTQAGKAVGGPGLNAQAPTVEPPKAELAVKPKLCVIRSGEEHCDVKIRVEWRADRPDLYCVFSKGNKEPLQCWDEAQFGDMLDELNASSNKEYRLEWMDSESGKTAVLAAAGIKVVVIVPADRRKQRRRRHIWSVF